MPTTRLLLVMLWTLLLLADAIALRHALPFPHPMAALLLGLVIGQVGLVATWGACSQRSWLVRVPLVWTCAALAAWPLAHCSGPSWRAWAGLLLIFAMIVVAAWKLLLGAGYRWSLSTAATAAASSLRPHQFSLAWMLQATTALALALGVGSWLALPASQPWLAVASIIILALLLPLVVSTLLLQTDRWWLRGALMLIVPLGGAAFLMMNRGPTPMFLTLLLGVESLVALLAATVLSVAGVSLQPVTESTAQGESPPGLRLADAL